MDDVNEILKINTLMLIGKTLSLDSIFNVFRDCEAYCENESPSSFNQYNSTEWELIKHLSSLRVNHGYNKTDN